MTNSSRATLRKMTSYSVLKSAFLLSGLITICSSNLKITSSPQTVSNATLGSTVRFECQTSTASVVPEWNINGRDYRVAELPLGYRYESNQNSKVLIVSPVEIAMNNSVYYCVLTFLTSEGYVRVESERAMIIIQVLNYYSSVLQSLSIGSLKATTLQVKDTVTNVLQVKDTVTNSLQVKDTVTNSLQVKDTVTNSLQHSITPPTQTMSVLFTKYLATTPGAKTEYTSSPAATKDYYSLQHKIPVMVITLASAVVVLLLTSTIAVAVWICRHRRRKDEPKSGTKCTGQQVYDEISAVSALPSVHPNPSYEQCELKVEKNPAYEFIKEPQSYTSRNPGDHVYDVIEELQKTS